jgi:hypothetical protein
MSRIISPEMPAVVATQLIDLIRGHTEHQAQFS